MRIALIVAMLSVSLFVALLVAAAALKAAAGAYGPPEDAAAELGN